MAAFIDWPEYLGSFAVISFLTFTFTFIVSKLYRAPENEIKNGGSLTGIKEIDPFVIFSNSTFPP